MTATAPRLVLRHPGPCGSRSRCWRPECLRRFGDYQTIEILPWTVLARCHGRAYDRLEAMTRLQEAVAA